MNHLTDPDKPKSWNPSQLRPGLPDQDLAEDLAAFFMKITNEFEPLDMSKIPVTYSNPLPILAPHKVADMIRKAKKPSSTVQGDIILSLVGELADFIAIPVTRVFNIAHLTLSWPGPWKLETQTPIPKTSNPSTYEEIRNILCTNLMSKILESILLDLLQKEIPLKYSQLGGIRNWNKPLLY